MIGTGVLFSLIFPVIAIANIQDGRISSAPMEAGDHSLEWNTESLASGIYFVTLRFADELKTSKTVVIK